MATLVAVILLGLVGLIVLLRPRNGLLWKWVQGREAAERINIEDALKHFYNFEYSRLSATIASLAGVLQIGRDEAAGLAARLESLGLVTRDASGIRLTAEGRSYALRVIRVHRLWERFLRVPVASRGRPEGAPVDAGTGRKSLGRTGQPDV